MNRKIRVGVVGCGGMGGGHAVALLSGTGNAVWQIDNTDVAGFHNPETTDISPLLELAGIVDIREDRREWAKKQGMTVYPDYESMLGDPGVDAVLVATPNHLHKEQSIAAMRAGKHVLCEKPVVISSDEMREVMAVSRETGKVFYPRQNREWDEDYLMVKKIVDEKLLGNVFNVKYHVMGSRGIPGDWRADKACGGGMMLDWGVHIIDRTLKLFPEKLTRLFCVCSHVTNDECDDGFQLTMTFESGVRVNAEVGTCHFVGEPLWYVYGDRGSARIDNWSNEGKMVRLLSWNDRDAVPVMAGSGLTKTMAPRKNNDSVEELPLPKVAFDRNALYRNFAEVCHGMAPQIVTQEHALRVLRVMEAAMRSDATHQVVEFEP